MTLQLRFLGISGFDIEEDSRRLVIDPFLSGDREMGLPPSPVAMEELDGVELILVTHGAYDHLGQAVELATRNSNAILCCGVDVRVHAIREGLPASRIAKMIYGCSFTQNQVTIKPLGARHLSFFQSHGEYLTGQPLSYLIQTGEHRIFHSGDTSLFGDLKLYGELYQPDIALLCVGAAEGNLAPLPPEEAAIAADWLNARLTIPMHFRPGSSEPQEFADCLSRRRPDLEVVQLRPGERLQLTGGTT